MRLKNYISAFNLAQVVKLVDTPDLGSGAARCGGSSPLLGNYLLFISKQRPLIFKEALKKYPTILCIKFLFNKGSKQKKGGKSHIN